MNDQTANKSSEASGSTVHTTDLNGVTGGVDPTRLQFDRIMEFNRMDEFFTRGGLGEFNS